MDIPSSHLLNAAAYATERLLARAIHDEHVSADAVVVLDAVIDHFLEEAPRLDRAALVAETQLTGEQLDHCLQALQTQGYLPQLAQYALMLTPWPPAAAGRAA